MVGQLLQLRLEHGGITVSGEPAAIAGMLHTQLTCLEALAKADMGLEPAKGHAIAYTTVLISGLLDAMPEGDERTAAIRRFQAAVRPTSGYVIDRFDQNLKRMSELDAIRAAAGSDYGDAYLITQSWMKYMPPNHPTN